MTARRHVHTRSIRVDAYARDDGLWDLEATLTDTKSRDFKLATGVRRQGEPVHDMRLVVTIDTHLTIVAVQAQSSWVPYPGDCDAFPEAYQALVGLNLAQDFRRHVRERLGGVRGCTHLTDLTALLPTAAIQAFSGEVIKVADGSEGDDPAHAARRPHQIDRCRALRADGPAVARYYPRWHRAPQAPGDADKTHHPEGHDA